MILGQVKPSLNELTHHGTMGMKWGQHKSIISSKEQIKNAATATGKSINKSISYALHHKQMIVGGIAAAGILHNAGTIAIRVGKSGILAKAYKNREAAYKSGKLAMKMLSSEAAKINYAKMANGVYKITTLK